MKTTNFTYSPYEFIDIAPLAARYAILTQAILTFAIMGQPCRAMRVTQKVIRLIRLYARLDTQNKLRARKLEMLSDRGWRERVLRDLGGLRKLRLWEAAKARILQKRGAPVKRPEPQEPAWLYTPERIAESERLKARARRCMRACHNPLIVRDRFRMDFDGQFRLAPLPRCERAPRQLKVYTQQTISEYDWDPTPFGKDDVLGVAIVWPVEFYAAAALEAKIETARSNLVLTENARSADEPRPDPTAETLPLDLPLREGNIVSRDNRRKSGGAVPLHLVLDRKTYDDIFENPV